MRGGRTRILKAPSCTLCSLPVLVVALVLKPLKVRRPTFSILKDKQGLQNVKAYTLHCERWVRPTGHAGLHSSAREMAKAYTSHAERWLKPTKCKAYTFIADVKAYTVHARR